MKARIDWIIHGECNTTYSYISTLVRRSRNIISSILNDNGEWVHNIEEVKDIFVTYFKKLYQTKQICTPSIMNGIMVGVLPFLGKKPTLLHIALLIRKYGMS